MKNLGFNRCKPLPFLSVCSAAAVLVLFQCSDTSCGTGDINDSCPTGRYQNEVYTKADYPSGFAGGPTSPIEQTYGNNYTDDAMLWDSNSANDDLSKKEDLKLDLYLPPPKDTFTNRPVMVFVHGGGFVSGDKTGMQKYATSFALRGWVAVSINYRLFPKANAAGQIFYVVQQEGYDAKAAIRWVKKHISEHGGDPSRIGIGGTSAGGFLANEVGYNNDGATDSSENGEGNTNNLFLTEGINSEVLAVMDKSGGIISQHHLTDIVDPGEPPALVFHCENDPTVVFQDAIDFTTAMKSAGNFYHSDDNFIPGHQHGISADLVLPIMAPFFTKYVAGHEVATIPTLISTGVTTCPETNGED